MSNGLRLRNYCIRLTAPPLSSQLTLIKDRLQQLNDRPRRLRQRGQPTHRPRRTTCIRRCASSSSTELKSENNRSVFAALIMRSPFLLSAPTSVLPLAPSSATFESLSREALFKDDWAPVGMLEEAEADWKRLEPDTSSTGVISPASSPPSGSGGRAEHTIPGGCGLATLGCCQKDWGSARCFIGSGSESKEKRI